MGTRIKAFSFIEVVIAVAVVSALSTVLFPFLEQRKSKITNKPNLETIAKGARLYGNDFDDRIPIIANGPERSLVSTPDGTLTRFGEQRTDHWPLLLLPYVKDRGVFQDPRRDDMYHVWDRPAHSTMDPGYEPFGATYRNQNRYPCFGVNHIFLSPMESVDGTSAQVTRGISKSFAQAKDPARTIFYVPTTRGLIPSSADVGQGVPDKVRGFYLINAPGMGGLASTKRLIIMHTGLPCSADWCGDFDVHTPGEQRLANFAYIERVLKGNNVAFLDGHVKFMSDRDMAAGTNYLKARPHGVQNLEGAVITDRRKYLWNLDDNYYGLY